MLMNLHVKVTLRDVPDDASSGKRNEMIISLPLNNDHISKNK